MRRMSLHMNTRIRTRLAVMWNANLNCIPKDKASGTGACFMMCIHFTSRPLPPPSPVTDFCPSTTFYGCGLLPQRRLRLDRTTRQRPQLAPTAHSAKRLASYLSQCLALTLSVHLSLRLSDCLSDCLLSSSLLS